MTETPNLNYIKELSGEDTDFEKKFIDIIKQEFPVEVNTYCHHIEQNQWDMAAEIVHKLKHKFNILGMEQAYGLAVTYEENLRKRDTGLDKDFKEILNDISQYLRSI